MKNYKKKLGIISFLSLAIRKYWTNYKFQLFKILTNFKIEIYYLLILDLNKPDSYSI